MKKSENKLHLIESVIEKRKKTFPAIIADEFVFRNILKGANVRREIYERLREEAGPLASYGNATWKNYFLWPTHPIKGIPENNRTEAIVSLMHFVLTEALMQHLVVMRAENKSLSELIKKTEKYLPEYEQKIKETADSCEA